MAKNNIAIPAAIIAWPMLPGNLDWVASCRRSMTNLHAQKTAATAKPTVPIQFTALNQMGDPLFGGMFIAVMSIAGIDPSGSVAYSVHERTGSKRGFMAAYIQAVTMSNSAQRDARNSRDESARASDTDRIQITQLLAYAAEQGRLQLTDYEDRLARAYAATTYQELDRLRADLPGRR